MIIQIFSNSRIFPCMEHFLVNFQVFHDFQSLWEPWLYLEAWKLSLTDLHLLLCVVNTALVCR